MKRANRKWKMESIILKKNNSVATVHLWQAKHEVTLLLCFSSLMRIWDGPARFQPSLISVTALGVSLVGKRFAGPIMKNKRFC